MRVLIAVLMALPLSAFAAEPDLTGSKFGERRAWFGDVLAACRPLEGLAANEIGYCSVNLYSGAEGPWTDFQLRVGSPMPGADYELSLIAVEAYALDDTDMAISVDGEIVAILGAGEDLGWYPQGSVNDYFVGQSTANLSVLPAMRAGRRIGFSYLGEGGARVGVGFSLRGLNDALNWIEGARF